MKRRVLSFLFIMILIFTAMPAYASGSLTGVSEDKVILTLDENTSSDLIATADVLVVAYEDLNLIESNAKEIVDTGKMLYITSPQVSAEDIAVRLTIPKEGISSYNEQTLVAYSIYKVEGLYVYQNHYVAVGEVVNENKLSKQTDKLRSLSSDDKNQEVPLPAAGESNFNLVNTIQRNDATELKMITDGIDVAIESMSTTIEQVDDEVHNKYDVGKIVPFSTSWPSTAVSRMYVDTLNVYDNNGKSYGYLKGTVKVYDVGRVLVNNISQLVYNVISRVEVYPLSNIKVKQYKVRIHCNIVGHTMLETTTLPSGINYSQGVSLQGTFNKSDGAGGSISYNTSWTYNPESQKINRSSPQDKVVDWTAETVSATEGKSYDIAPGMTIASVGQTGQRGAFSKIYCDAYTIFNIVLNSNSLEIGGWF